MHCIDSLYFGPSPAAHKVQIIDDRADTRVPQYRNSILYFRWYHASSGGFDLRFVTRMLSIFPYLSSKDSAIIAAHPSCCSHHFTKVGNSWFKAFYGLG